MVSKKQRGWPNPNWTLREVMRCDAHAQMEPSVVEWECSHWMQATSKELPANLHGLGQCEAGVLGPDVQAVQLEWSGGSDNNDDDDDDDNNMAPFHGLWRQLK